MASAIIDLGPLSDDAPVWRLMRRAPVFVQSSLTLRQVSEVLDNEAIGMVLVRRQGRLAGVISERDLIRALAEGADPDGDRVDDVMTDDVATIDRDTPIGTAAQLMLDNQIRHLPVTEGDVVIGVVSLRAVMEAHEEVGA